MPEATLKWPNDVLLAGDKLAGVLCETRWQGASPDLVVGFGVNVLQREFPAELHATSLARCLPEGTCPLRQDVLTAVLAGLEPALRGFFAGGFPAIRADYERHSAVLGKVLRVGGAPAEAVGFDDDGALRVRPPGGGPSRRVEAEDVWLGSGRA